MFDTPDLIPLCLAPWIGLGVGALVFILVFIGAKRWSRVRWYVAVATGIVVVPLICYASFMLRIGEGDPTPWFEPTAKDVIGTWHLDSGTVSHLSIFNGYSTPLHRLEFEGDGTFTIWNAPNFWITLADAGGDDQTEFNAHGRWRIVTRFNLPFVLLMFESISIEDLEESETRMYFEGHLPPYRLNARGFDTFNPMFIFVKE